MKKKFFGTDGIRGLVNKGSMTPGMLTKIAQATGLYFQKEPRRHIVVIGKDTRLSGYLVEPALTSGFISMGMDVVLVGPVPTPAVSLLTKSLRADLGVMISASHNPYTDNGLKFFTSEGHKLTDAQELEIEELVQTFDQKKLSPATTLGRAKRLDDAAGRYVEFIKSTFPAGKRLDGLKVVIDCANGAAYKIAPMVLWELGAEVIAIGVDPNGRNINLDCGATSPQTMAERVLEEKADIGIALDGDADRIIISDEKGTIIEGDKIIGAIAYAWKKEGRLKNNCIVTTIMSNGGLKKYLEKENVQVIQTPVGDRHVGQAMNKYGCNIGGEPSGHVILNDYGATGDGLLTALQILAIMVQSGDKASKICTPFSLSPQMIKNIPLHNKSLLEEGDVKNKIEKLSENLKKEGGRVLVRPSGTEPVVRIMAEGPNKEDLAHAISTIAAFLKEEDKDRNA